MGNHKIGKTRTNQYGSWTSCARCGLRTSYKAKEGQTGQHRQAGPDLHVINIATEELKQTMGSDQCTEKVMNGKPCKSRASSSRWESARQWPST